MLTLIIPCTRLTTEQHINTVIGVGGYSGMQIYDRYTGDVVLTIQSEEVGTEIEFLSKVIWELHDQQIEYILTNKEV